MKFVLFVSLESCARKSFVCFFVPLVTLLHALTYFIRDSQAKLCICMSLVRGLSKPVHGPLGHFPINSTKTI